MSRVTQLRTKNSDGSFGTPYPIGAQGVNIYLDDGNNLETEITNLKDNIDKKADKNHASTTTDYGVGTEKQYGHLKITDTYDEIGDDSSKTAISQAGIVQMYEELLDMKVQVFYVLDDDKLFSIYNTAYDVSNSENTLTLIADFFEIEENSDGYSLIIKD